MKLMLRLFLDEVVSERELIRVIPLRIDYLCFLGCGFEDEIPGHSVLSKARARWAGQCIQELHGFVRRLLLAQRQKRSSLLMLSRLSKIGLHGNGPSRYHFG